MKIGRRNRETRDRHTREIDRWIYDISMRLTNSFQYIHILNLELYEFRMRMCHFQKEVNFDINHLKIETYKNLSPVNIFENQEISQERKNSPNHFCPSMFRRRISWFYLKKKK